MSIKLGGQNINDNVESKKSQKKEMGSVPLPPPPTYVIMLSCCTGKTLNSPGLHAFSNAIARIK